MPRAEFLVPREDSGARASRPQQRRTREGARNFQRPSSGVAAAAGTAALRWLRLRRSVFNASLWSFHWFPLHRHGTAWARLRHRQQLGNGLVIRGEHFQSVLPPSEGGSFTGPVPRCVVTKADTECPPSAGIGAPSRPPRRPRQKTGNQPRAVFATGRLWLPEDAQTKAARRSGDRFPELARPCCSPIAFRASAAAPCAAWSSHSPVPPVP